MLLIEAVVSLGKPHDQQKIQCLLTSAVITLKYCSLNSPFPFIILKYNFIPYRVIKKISESVNIWKACHNHESLLVNYANYWEKYKMYLDVVTALKEIKSVKVGDRNGVTS
jgi:hypothetical protein